MNRAPGACRNTRATPTAPRRRALAAAALAGLLAAGCGAADETDDGIAVSSAITVSNLSDASVRIDHRVSRADSVVVIAIAAIDPEPQSHVVGDQTDGTLRVIDLLVSHRVGDVQLKLFAQAYAEPGLLRFNVTSAGGVDQLIAVATITGAGSFGATAMDGELSDQGRVEIPSAGEGDRVLGLFAGREAEIDAISAEGTRHLLGDVGVGRAVLASAPGGDPLLVNFSEPQNWAAVALAFTP